MTAITDPKNIPARISSGFSAIDQICISGFYTTKTTFGAVTAGSPSGAIAFIEPALLQDLPSLPSGVTSFIPLEVSINSGSAVQALLVEKILLGTLDIATNTFTDGNAMPTKTVFNTSHQIPSPVFAEFTTAPGGTSRTFTITYVDQDGNTAETNTAVSITNSASIYAGLSVPLNAGDWGVLDITNANLAAGSSPSGVISFYGVVPIAMWYPGTSTIASTMDILNSGIIRRIGASADIGLFFLGALAAAGSIGNIFWLGDS